MVPQLPHCPYCKTPIPEVRYNRPEFTPCPGCGNPVHVEIFPALFRRMAPGTHGEALVVEGESSCFYHPQKKAACLCDGCGRFVCALCDCELHGQHYCPACVEAGRTRGKIKNLQNSRACYDSLALSLTVYPIALSVVGIGVYAMPITAPAALYVAIRYWTAPRSMVTPGSGRFIAAIILALLQISGWTFVIYEIVTHHR